MASVLFFVLDLLGFSDAPTYSLYTKKAFPTYSPFCGPRIFGYYAFPTIKARLVFFI